MIRNLAVVLAALIGDFSHGRMWLCIIGSTCIVGLVYFVALPFELPVWPALIVVGASGIIGLYWERRASQRLGVGSNLLMNRNAKKRPLS